MSGWLDVMPAIPLEVGTPIVQIEDGRRGWWRLSMREGGYDHTDPSIVRVDLSTPYGFWYALRRLTSVPEHFDALAAALGDVDVEWAVEWATGLALGPATPNDVDRLVLARAFREIS